MTSRLAPLLLVFALAGCPSSTTQGTDAATGTDAAVTVDAGATTDTSAVGNGVTCAGMTCAANQVCCGGSTAVVCQASTAACDGQTLACDGPEDCPGARCCQNIGSMCAASCTGGQRICHASTDCETGESCCPNGGGVPQGQLMHCTTLAAGTSCPLPP